MKKIYNNLIVLYLLKFAASACIYFLCFFIFSQKNEIENPLYYFWFFCIGQFVLNLIWVIAFYIICYIFSHTLTMHKMAMFILSFSIIGITEILISKTRELKNAITSDKYNFNEEFMYSFWGLILSCFIFVMAYQIIGRKFIMHPAPLP